MHYYTRGELVMEWGEWIIDWGELTPIALGAIATSTWGELVGWASWHLIGPAMRLEILGRLAYREL